MKLLGKIKNGNYFMYIFDDGTKVRKNDLDFFEAEKPESMDLKITNKCCLGMNCQFCHEDSGPKGKHGDIMNLKFIDTLLPFTELAIGGGNPLEHPDLIPFLEKCKSKNLICNMTVNQQHFMLHEDLIKDLIDRKLIWGLGVSLTYPSAEFISKIQKYPNAVIHLINGVHTLYEIEKLYDKDLKILFLGFKDFRRGLSYHSSTTDEIKNDLKDNLPEILKRFKVVSFDNLALKQMDVRRLLSEEEWNEFYMGDDGQATLFVDAVEKTFSKSSTTPIEERKPLLDDIKPMFDYVRVH